MVNTTDIEHLIETLKNLDIKKVKVHVDDKGIGFKYTDPLSGGRYYDTEVIHWIKYSN